MLYIALALFFPARFLCQEEMFSDICVRQNSFLQPLPLKEAHHSQSSSRKQQNNWRAASFCKGRERDGSTSNPAALPAALFPLASSSQQGSYPLALPGPFLLTTPGPPPSSGSPRAVGVLWHVLLVLRRELPLPRFALGQLPCFALHTLTCLRRDGEERAAPATAGHSYHSKIFSLAEF